MNACYLLLTFATQPEHFLLSSQRLGDKEKRPKEKEGKRTCLSQSSPVNPSVLKIPLPCRFPVVHTSRLCGFCESARCRLACKKNFHSHPQVLARKSEKERRRKHRVQIYFLPIQKHRSIDLAVRVTLSIFIDTFSQ
jgi:hypothetical protein